MLATSVTTRHPDEAHLLAQALAGDQAALDRVLTHLSSPNTWLQQIMCEAIADDGRPEVWQWLLNGLAHGWGPVVAPRRPPPPERRARIEAAIVRLFVADYAPTGAGLEAQRQVLMQALESTGARLRQAAATLLGLRGDTRGFEHLVAAMREADPPARLRAVEALGRLKDERAGPVLVEALADLGDVELHHASAHALSALKAHALPAVMEALHHPARHVRWHACRLLGDLGDVRAAPALAEALDDEAYNIRWAAAESLASLGAAAIPAVLARLAHYAAHDDTYHAAHYTLHRLALGEWHARLAPLLATLNGPAPEAAAPGLAQQLLDTYGGSA
jgi:hypothetical protein